ncbi:MAG: PIG-L family deacetylase [Anaerolineales bacterium]|nr:PIG-L family deacetylase [Anaerolineales bacterium]
MKILAFFAHPDDETIFLGGTFAFLAGRGVEIHFLCATRGEGGEMGDPPICAREELGQVREEELRCAVKVLGGESTRFLNYRDPEVGSNGDLFSFTDNLEDLVHDLQAEIQRVQPAVVITHGPGGEYGHPAHIQAHAGVMGALTHSSSKTPIVYAPSYHSRKTGVFTPEPDFLLDISSSKTQKTQAITCYRSQHDLFLRHGEARAGRPVTLPEIVRTEEGLFRIHPPVSGSPDDLLAELLFERSIPVQK